MAFVSVSARALTFQRSITERLSCSTRSQSVRRLSSVRARMECSETSRTDTPSVSAAPTDLADDFYIPAESSPSDTSFVYALLGLAVSTATTIATAAPAEAAVPDGLKEAFKTIPASLAHPAIMWAVFGFSIYAFYLGWQSRQIRSVDAERRKELVKKKVTQRHFVVASNLFAVMTLFTFAGMANTYTRTGKLFPGPHLYVGLGLVALMSAMTAAVPYMQQGKTWAKNAHFAAAFGALGLFGWQAKSGMVIVGKLLKW